MRYNPLIRVAKYEDLKHAVEKAGYRVEIFQGRNKVDAIALYLNDSDGRYNFLWVGKRDRGWFLHLPGTRHYYRIPVIEQVMELCLRLLAEEGRHNSTWSQLDDEVKREFQLVPVSSLVWLQDELEEELQAWQKLGWKELTRAQEDAVWDSFERSFQTPNGEIQEPTPSLTWKISSIYSQDETRFEETDVDLTLKTLIALQKCTKHGEALYALNWNHTCYYFDPHGGVIDAYRDSWAIPVLPNGDSYIFLAPDFRFGIIGNWKGTICVFGEELLNALRENPPAIFKKLVRTNGNSVRSPLF
jgi:hypothetical protein